MTAEEKLHIVYLIIVGAQHMLERGQPATAWQLIDTARLVAISNNAFLEANMEQIKQDMALAESLIADAQFR